MKHNPASSKKSNARIVLSALGLFISLLGMVASVPEKFGFEELRTWIFLCCVAVMLICWYFLVKKDRPQTESFQGPYIHPET